MDTRQWLSYGIVKADTESGPSVRFADDAGDPLPHGVLVTATLQPSGIDVPCRVGSHVAGQGEAEYYPYVAGDEVVVAVMEGDERAGCVILCRLNQSLDTFPKTVGGQDVTKNNFGFKRSRAPYVFETAESLMFRGATTNWQLTFDRTGNLIIGSGDKHHLVLNTAGVILGLGDDSVSIQMAPASSNPLGLAAMAINAGKVALSLSEDQTNLFTPGIFKVSTTGIGATGHAISAESVIAIVDSLLTAIGIVNPGPIASGAALAGAKVGIINALIPLAAVLPVAPYTAAITGALQIPGDPTGIIAGFGRPGFLL